MGSEDEWIDIAAAAERASCSPQAIPDGSRLGF